MTSQVSSRLVEARVKHLLREVVELSADGSERLLSVSEYYGVAPRAEVVDAGDHLSRAESLEGYKKCVPGDLVMNIMLAWKRALGVTSYEGIVSPAYAVFRPNSNRISSRFAHYFFRSDSLVSEFKRLSTGVIDSRLRLYPEVFGAMTVQIPPVHQQERIANFLDEQTARIDALIAEKENLRLSLGEMLAATLERSFVGAESAELSWKTGSIFFPQLPVSWKRCALKHLVATPITDGPHETPDFVDQGIPFVSAEAVKGGRVDFERKRGYITPELHTVYCAKVKPQRDDIFMVKSGNTTGAVAIVEIDDEFSVWSPLAVIRADTLKVLPEFLYLALQTPYFQRSVQLFWSQGTQPNIGMAVLENLQVALPPLAQQKTIVDGARRIRDSVLALSVHVEEHITRLREYRSSLISAAVTGQLDISTFKAAA